MTDTSKLPEQDPAFYGQQEEKEEQANPSAVPIKGHHLKTRDLMRLSVRIFKMRPLRSFLTILGISFGIGTVLFLVSLGYGLQFLLIGKLATTEDSLISMEAYPPDSGINIYEEDLDRVLAMPESDEVSPIAEFTDAEVSLGDNSGFLFAKIIRTSYFRLAGTEPQIGEVLDEGDRSVIISSAALRLFGLPEDETTLGTEVNVEVFYLDDEGFAQDIPQAIGGLTIKGIITDELQPPFVLIPFSIVDERPPFYQRFFVKATDIDTVDVLRNNLIDEGYIISARIDLITQAKKILTAITAILAVFGGTALIVSAIGMFNTMIIGFMERVFEVGIMKSIGATRADIRNLFLMEALIMGLLGGIGGILIGVGVGELFNFGLNVLANQLGGDEIKLFIYPPTFMILIVIVSALVGIGSGVWPARKASRLSPKEAFARG